MTPIERDDTVYGETYVREAEALAEIQSLRAEREAIYLQHGERLHAAERDAAENATLRAQVAGLEKDAERWQWWRGNTSASRAGRDGQRFAFPAMPLGTRNLMQGSVAQHLDSIVDAAILATKETPK